MAAAAASAATITTDDIQYLQHRTTLNVLDKIFEAGELQTRAAQGLQQSKLAPHPDFVFFTPFSKRIIPDSMLNHIVVMIFDGPRILDSFPYFINEGNSFGPLNGKCTSKKSCKCRHTYHHKLETIRSPINSSRLFDPPDSACGKDSLKEFLKDVEINDLDTCDGGPEVGVYGNVPLDFLQEIIITRAAYERLSMRNDPRYKDKFFIVESKVPKVPKALNISSTLRYTRNATRKSARGTRRRRRLIKRK